jgi:hypothetical protein
MPTGAWRFASVSLRSALCSFSALISSTPHFRQKLSSGRISDPQIQHLSCTKPALTRISLTVNLNILRRIEAYLSILAPLGIVGSWGGLCGYFRFNKEPLDFSAVHWLPFSAGSRASCPYSQESYSKDSTTRLRRSRHA